MAVTALKVLVLLLQACGSLGWNPDAGLVVSFTKLKGTVTNATSKYDDAFHINDGNDTTHWTSGGCLPSAYMANGYLNVLNGICADGLCSSPSASLTELADATDGSTYTAANIPLKDGKAVFEITLKAAVKLRYLTIRGRYSADVNMEVYNGAIVAFTKILGTADNYKIETFNLTLTTVTNIKLTSDAKFTLTEIDALGEAGCTERAWVDLGSVRTIGVIRTRHWAGGSTLATRLLTSVDGTQWTEVTKLEPGALRAVFTELDIPVQARYIAVEHHVSEHRYAKAYVWEIDAWDRHGRWGAPPKDSENHSTLKEIFGVNGIWGWGNNKYSTNLGSSKGPRLYSDIASHARNYHNLGWDEKDPDKTPDYVAMAAGHGTNGQPWLNWDTEYKAWVASNLTVDASIQFTSKGGFPPSVWGNPYQDSFNYGRDFAAHFGESKGNGLIKAMEVGNEPWDYPADFYATVLNGMSRGVKSVDQNLLVLPGAFQAHDKFASSNYIGPRVKSDFARNIDVINGHFYSFFARPDGARVMTYPENLGSEFNGVINLLRWRDVNMPGKPVWITEWGWDSRTTGENCRYAECVSEEAQAIYGLRGLMVLARFGIQRATWFFYADSKDCDNHIFCRSGLTASLTHNFAKKKVFYSFHNLLGIIGDKHFLKVLHEDKSMYVYLFGDHSHGNTAWWATHVVVWRPVDASDMNSVQVSFYLASKPTGAWRIKAGNLAPEKIAYGYSSDHVTVDVTPEPLVMTIAGFALSPQTQIIG